MAGIFGGLMAQLRVVVIGTSPAETLSLKEALRRIGPLKDFQYLGLQQALDQAPDWDEWDLVISHYQTLTGSGLLSLLEPVLRKASPPVIFMVEPYDPVIVTRLLNAGGQRVLPLKGFEDVLEPTILAVFDKSKLEAVSAFQVAGNGRLFMAGQEGDPPGSGSISEYLPRLFKRIPVAMCVVRLNDRRYVDCNESFARLLSRPREDLIGRVALELGLPDDIQAHFGEARQGDSIRLSQPVVQLERKIITRSRQERYVQIHLDRTEWNGEDCLFALVQDITETEKVKERIRQFNDDLERLVFVRTGELEAEVNRRKAVELELRQSRDRYQILAEAAHDLIFMVSKDGLMEYANAYASQVFGFEAGKVIGMPAKKFFPKGFTGNQFQKFFGESAINYAVYTEGSFTQDGALFWIGTWLVPIQNDQGNLVSILGISRDISEQKTTLAAIQKALQNERKLGEMRSSFFSMTSHQFRTPLSTILLSNELLQKYGQRWDDQKRSEHLGRIEEAANRLNSMLEDILVIGRVESGRYLCVPRDFELIAFVDETIRELAANDRGDHRVVFEHEVVHLPVFLDPEVLHRVVDNLLSNAIKYSPKGTEIHILVRAEEQHFMIEVTDQGIGIPERDIKYLFEPFQRGSNAGEYPGSGIGLTIIQKSVELMNGSVSVKSTEGQGTTFIVRFPIRLARTADTFLPSS